MCVADHVTVGTYESDFCKAQVRNIYVNADPDFVVFPLTVRHIKQVRGV